MAVTIRYDLLRMQPQLRLKLVHAAIGSYPCRTVKASLPLNRLLLIFADSGRDDSFIRDLATGELLPMRRDCGYFIPCGHEIDQHQTEELRFVSFQFTLDLFYGFDVMAKFPECRVIRSPELIAEAQRLIRLPDAPAAVCRINEILYGLCAQWLAEKPGILDGELKYADYYRPLRDYVEKEGSALTTVAMLAEMHDMRQDVFSRKFTAEMGFSPKEFLSRVLVRKALRLLDDSRLRIKDVAERLEFSSEYYFSRFFKRHTGFSPREFRKKTARPPGSEGAPDRVRPGR